MNRHCAAETRGHRQVAPNITVLIQAAGVAAAWFSANTRELFAAGASASKTANIRFFVIMCSSFNHLFYTTWRFYWPDG
jgi:hypothetical protein